ncbi:uncharacterized protein LOC142980857 [Anticarsia gemmatalis]|uniref:uncharacterized protein LOC142980857 n=1 Tax=Anticarsia gemmatalis TaxID=129554 RepID=UPI003F7623E9
MWQIITWVLLFTWQRAAADETVTHHYDSLFNLHADTVLEQILGTDIYQAKAKLKQTMERIHSKEAQLSLAPSAQPLNGTDSTPYETDKTSTKYDTLRAVTHRTKNLTEEQIKRKRDFIRIEYIMRQRTRVPRLDSAEDELAAVTRRFERALRSAAPPGNRSRRQGQLATRRELYVSHAALIGSTKKRIWGLMEQFVYETRYKLPYVQLLRKKYRNSIKYRVGYLMSLVRTLVGDFSRLYDAYLDHGVSWHAVPTFNWHLRMYEAAVRHKTDFMDILEYLKRLEYQRQINYNPDYYDGEGGDP